MGFNINSFRKSLKTIQRPTHFKVFVYPSQSMLQKGLYANTEFLSYTAKKAVIPGQQIQTNESRVEYGPIRKVGYSNLYMDAAIDFYVDGEFYVKEMFDTWQRDQQGKPEDQNLETPGDFDPKFYDQYIGKVVVVQYSPQGKQIYQTTLVEAYPIQVSELNLDWADKDQIHILNVQFAYRYHINKKL